MTASPLVQERAHAAHRLPTRPAALAAAAADAWAGSPRQLMQRKAIAAAFGVHVMPMPMPDVAQCKGHKPKVGQTIRYPATGPNDGQAYTVVSASEGGELEVRDARNRTSHLDWTSDNIWLVYADDPKDSDHRMKASDWAGLSKDQKRLAYQAAKEKALEHLLAAAENGMVNATTARNLALIKLAWFNKIRAGEWRLVWEEINQRKWQFTIDMDRPEATSWQEPHVGWEVKLLEAGANHSDQPYAAFAKQQGHVWMNEVPEARV